MPVSSAWRPSMGANVLPGGGVHFRVWAPGAQKVEVLFEPDAEGVALPAERMVRDDDGVWQADVAAAGAGARYRFRLDGGEAYPDPWSRSQPEGVHGPSEVVDPAAFAWTDAGWQGLSMDGLTIYECHVGTATPAGTFDGLIEDLDRLRRLGVGTIQVMPVAAFPGRWGWGYDGVDLFAPAAVYGGPEGLRRLVDGAHARGVGVILDVVYNHLGPAGNYLRQFSPAYFTDRHQTPWGDAINYDGEGSRFVRQMVLDNALYWLHEYHLDGLRLDAVHEIRDDSTPHLLAELSERVGRHFRRHGAASAQAGSPRGVVLIAETDQNDPRYLRTLDDGGYGLDAVWADDLHHTLRRFLCGDHEGYYADYTGTLEEVARTIQQGWLYDGRWSEHLGRMRGTPAPFQPAYQFLVALQNHDQVGNRPFGDRLHHSLDLDRYRAASALLLTLPFTPMLFMGQEFAASSPFLYFTDHEPDLGRLVTEGRRKEFGAFSAFSDPAMRERIPDPQAEDTFRRSKLPREEALRPPGAQVQALYQVLLGLRRADPVLARQERGALRAWPIGAHILAVHRWSDAQHRLLLANFGDAVTVDLAQALHAAVGRDPNAPLDLFASPEPPPAGEWHVLLDTGERRFGGPGAETMLDGTRLALPRHTAVLLAATAARASGA